MEKTALELLKEREIRGKELIIKEMGVPFFNLYGKQIGSLMVQFELDSLRQLMKEIKNPTS